MAVYVGDLLTATAASVAGGPTPTRTWQWLRNGTAITGANSSTYTTVSADLGANISVRQTETNPLGSDSATSLTVGPVESFTVAQLFASGEEGAWYEPSTTTAFKATAVDDGFTDIVPCEFGTGDVANQQCAILLDKSQGAGYSGGSFTGLGSETVVNGDFETALGSEWQLYAIASGTSAIVNGALRISKTSSGGYGRYQSVSVEANKTYIFTFDVSNLSGAEAAASVWDQGSFPTAAISTLLITSNGSYNIVFNSGSNTSVFVYLSGNPNFIADFDNISVRELPGNHATQVTAGARPILARVPEGGRRNLLASSYDLNNASWTKISTPTVSASGTDPFGDAAYSVADDFSDFEWIVSSSITAATSTNYTVSFFVKKTTSATSFPGFSFLVGSNFQSVGINTDTGAILDRTVQSGGSANTTVTDYNADWWRIEITRSATSGNALRLDLFPAVMAGGTLSGTWTGSTTGSAIFAAPQLETGSTATAYQKVVDEYDITEAGVTSLEYLSFDGSDDWMSISGMSATAGPITLAAAFNVDVEPATETSAAYDFLVDIETGRVILSPRSGIGVSGIYQGATFDNVFTSIQRPYVMTGLLRTSGSLRLDGSEVSTFSMTQRPIGNQIGLGSRFDGSQSFCDGKVYGVIIRAADTTGSDLTNTEAYLANRSGVTL